MGTILADTPNTARRESSEDERKSPDEVEWRRWAREHLKPYLALRSFLDPDGLSNELSDVQDQLPPEYRIPEMTVLLAVLDGAPEWGQARFELHKNNCRDPRTVIDEKDAFFYHFCGTVLELHAGCLLDQGPRALENLDTWKDRRYQDGCAVIFNGRNSLQRAIVAAVHLRSSLAEFNAESQAAWPFQVHARVSIGPTWDHAVRGVPETSRGEFSLAHESLLLLDQSYLQLCLAAGARMGPVQAQCPRATVLPHLQERMA